MAELLTSPQLTDHRDPLIRPPASFIHRHLTRAEFLRIFAAHANTKDYPAVTEIIEVSYLACDNGRGIQRQQQHGSTDLRSMGKRSKPG
jgi:hypothetical protein